MLSNIKTAKLYKTIEAITPGFARIFVKRIFWRVVRCYNRFRYIEKGRFAELGYRFRFDRSHPYRVRIGARTITEDFNVWNAVNLLLGNCDQLKYTMRSIGLSSGLLKASRFVN